MKKKINYTQHLKLRLKLREIPFDLPKKIYLSKEKYFDKETDKMIAVKKARYKKKIREMVLIFEEIDNEINFITVHPLKVYQKVSRIKSGRWQKL